MERRNFLLGSVTAALTGLISGVEQVTKPVSAYIGRLRGLSPFAPIKGAEWGYTEPLMYHGTAHYLRTPLVQATCETEQSNWKKCECNTPNLNFTFITNNDGNIEEII